MTEDQRKLTKAIAELESKLASSQPKIKEDGTIGDGSYECMAGHFERCFGHACAVAEQAIELLKELASK